jgi:hypothetical protein
MFGIGKEEKYKARSKGGKISGNKAYENKTGIHAFSKEQRQNIGKQKWKCLVTGYISNAPGLSNYQRKRNIDTILRIKIED